MTDYIRRLVSGNKARFKDHNLNVELDLVYVTDQVIIMGYPASGLEGLYRNRREDAIKFLEHRHGKNYWVFNFCPIKENSYEADVFEGRVSRYPFPDHHAPPLAVMPLVAREMQAWLSGSPDRVAVLHCKAGKGRSGTMACAYLLSLDDAPMSPQLERSHDAKAWAKKRMESTINTLPAEEESVPANKSSPPFVASPPMSDIDGILDMDTGASPPRSATPNREMSFTDALKGVLDLHTAQRMKQSSEEGKVKQGVSIPSQRRFLYYWALLLAHDAPKHVWAHTDEPRPKVRLTQLKLRMRETSSVRMGIVKAANLVMERAGGSASVEKGSKSEVWASLTRYDDRLVNVLEEWEAHTRDPDGHMGKRRHGAESRTRGESIPDENLNEIYEGGKWDNGKMVRSFARMGVVNNSQERVVDEKGEKFHVYTLTPLSDKRWEGLKHDLHKSTAHGHPERQEMLEAIENQANTVGVSHSEANSMNDVTVASMKQENAHSALGANISEGIIVDAVREVRVKLYVGQVFIGWMWFVPTFHMPQPPPTSSTNTTSPSGAPAQPQSPSKTKATFTLTRKDIDFPIGLGSSIIDLDIDMEWVAPPRAGAADIPVEPLEPPVRAHTGDSKVGLEEEPSGTSAVGAMVRAVAARAEGGDDDVLGRVGWREAVEARQGGED
ncbi:phosphatases II [Pholiota conissans]|uniref:phosphatidylinositol-3,4,5-trisphosphate 3-phosphatase n=1 Tax=Pholiota conissans TaxID=109636 RepID=A0A9P6CYA9_9AGAR|nr:phosphatases II [Pholiota conissans]